MQQAVLSASMLEENFSFFTSTLSLMVTIRFIPASNFVS